MNRGLCVGTARTSIFALLAATAAAPAFAQAQQPDLQEELAAARAQIAEQQEMLRQQEERLRAIEQRLASTPPAASGVPAAQVSGSTVPGDPATAQQAPLERVGQAPADYDRPLEVAVLGQQGSVVTRAGQLTLEGQLEYARSDRNRAVFRGIEIVESVLIGVFDINESRQDVLTAAASVRYGVTDRLELGVRVPYVYRSDASVLVPVQGSTPDDEAASIDSSATGNGIGDIEVSARYQFLDGSGSRPFLIANLQAVFPTGTNPFEVPRDATGRALEAATGAGFYGISPSVTAILPSDPVVLFGTLGYTFNLADEVDTRIPPVIIEYVDPGDAVSASAGVGIAFNERTTVNFGYAHSWGFGTRTRTRPIEPTPANPDVPTTTNSRDLQIGRFLFGVTYRINQRESINWSVEVGATDDATDVRTVLRFPLVLMNGG